MSVILDPIIDEGHAYQHEGHRVFSVSQVLRLSGCMDGYEKIPQHLRDEALQRGTDVHKATAYRDCKRWGQPPAKFAPRTVALDGIRGYVEAYKLFCKEWDFEPQLVEKAMVVSLGSLWYGMTLDRAGSLRGAPTVVDLKTSAAFDPAWALQLAAYSNGMDQAYPRGGSLKWLRMAVRLRPDGTYMRPLVYDIPNDLAVFRCMLTALVWKFNNGKVKL